MLTSGVAMSGNDRAASANHMLFSPASCKFLEAPGRLEMWLSNGETLGMEAAKKSGWMLYPKWWSKNKTKKQQQQQTAMIRRCCWNKENKMMMGNDKKPISKYNLTIRSELDDSCWFSTEVGCRMLFEKFSGSDHPVPKGSGITQCTMSLMQHHNS